MSKNLTEGGILRARIKDSGLTIQGAADKLHMSRQNLHNYFTKQTLDEDFLHKVKRVLNIDLINTYNFDSDPQPLMVSEPESPALKRAKYGSVIALNNSDYVVMEVPLVNKFAYAGYLAGYGDNVYIKTLPQYAFMVDKEYKGAYLAFEVKGDSMDNGTRDGYVEGDIVLGREVPYHHWANKLHINKWDFVIVTKNDGILIKKITEHNTANGDIVLHSLNELYTDIKMNLKDVAQIFNVVQVSIKK